MKIGSHFLLVKMEFQNKFGVKQSGRSAAKYGAAAGFTLQVRRRIQAC
jgi:hypothetical protein